MPQESARITRWWRHELAQRGRPLTTSDVTVIRPQELRRATAASSLGNCMEWYDFGVYSYLAATIGAQFYPSGNTVAQLLASFGSFAVAFLVRPLGGVFFGPLGDRVGRTKVLATTMLMMAIGTFAIGVIPSYSQIGVAAPILLLVARMVQGFSTGGEYGGASTFTAEYAPDKRRGFSCSFLDFGTFIGYSLGSLVVTGMTLALPDSEMDSWGWRIPFLLAGPLGAVGLYIRLRLEETPAYRSTASGDHRHTLRLVASQYRRPLLVCVGLVLLYNVTNYMVTAYLPTYLTTTAGNPAAVADTLILAGMLTVVVVITFVGRASDRFGRRRMFTLGAIAQFIVAIPCFMLLNATDEIPALIGVVILSLVLACYAGTSAAALPALFPTRVRYTAMGLGFNIAVALFGGTTPLLTEALVSWTGDVMLPAYYLMVSAALGLIAVAYLPESAGLPLKGSGPQVSSDTEAVELAAATQRWFGRPRGHDPA